ncbi:MAG: FkbM family methyltransferase [Verrucomicrobiae bacterium]|nr:FkbM family methyltransferase [Verrucomicrobiae bacterium]
MPSLFERIWNSSPASLTRALQRRVRNLRAGEAWHEIAAGPARGRRMLLPTPLDSGTAELANGTFDQFLYEAIAGQRDLSGARCWDIGANIGYHSLALASQGAQVAAFEPGKANLARLKLHLEQNPEIAPRIKVFPVAVADRDGTVSFRESSDMTGASSGSHLSEAMPPLGAAVYAGFVECAVPAVTLDSLVTKQGEPPPDIVKIDVEGAEHLVLKGGMQMLARHKPLLLVEVHHICVMLSLTEILLALGYHISVLDRDHASPSRCFIMAR